MFHLSEMKLPDRQDYLGIFGIEWNDGLPMIKKEDIPSLISEKILILT